MSQLELSEVSKIYQVGDSSIPALDRVSLTVERGEFLSIFGSSGSGKTTLVSIAGGILRPNTGRVLFGGDDICAMDDVALSVYRVVPGSVLYFNLPVCCRSLLLGKT